MLDVWLIYGFPQDTALSLVLPYETEPHDAGSWPGSEPVMLDALLAIGTEHAEAEDGAFADSTPRNPRGFVKVFEWNLNETAAADSDAGGSWIEQTDLSGNDPEALTWAGSLPGNSTWRNWDVGQATVAFFDRVRVLEIPDRWPVPDGSPSPADVLANYSSLTGLRDRFGGAVVLSPDGKMIAMNSFCTRTNRAYCPGFSLQYERTIEPAA